MESNMLNNRAVKKPETTKPPTRLLASRIITALITNKNKPRVTIVAGSVKNISKGRTKRFSREITTATQSAVM